MREQICFLPLKNTYIFAFGLCGRLLEDGLHSLANAAPCTQNRGQKMTSAPVPMMPELLLFETLVWSGSICFEGCSVWLNKKALGE